MTKVYLSIDDVTTYIFRKWLIYQTRKVFFPL